MKFRIVLLIIICITGILTYKVFINFQERWQSIEVFQGGIIKSPLSVRHLFIHPKELGVDKWFPGDTAAYQLETNRERKIEKENKEISFQVVTQGSETNEQYWMRINGHLKFNDVDVAVWRFLNENSLHPENEIDGFIYPEGTFLLPFFSPMFPRHPIFLEKIGEALVETPVGVFACQHYFVQVRSPNGKLVPLLELWANPSVRPLGIVQARWRGETLKLVKLETSNLTKIPDVISEGSRQQKIREQGCVQCHHEAIGGKALQFLSMGSLSASALNITQCLFHYYQSELVKVEDPVQFQLLSEAKRDDLRMIQFAWKKGSFWVKANPHGGLILALDDVASQGNIHVIPRTGRLVLNLQN